jgi:hypothetical protein
MRSVLLAITPDEVGRANEQRLAVTTWLHKEKRILRKLGLVRGVADAQQVR